MSKGNVVIALLACAAAGALVGVLLAPDKGSATRKKLLKKGEAYAEGLTDKFDEIIEKIGDKFETAKGEAEKAVARAKASMAS